ncbi:MAG: DUF5320 domain-containing protein [Candidatus Heimdallarchaeota archaeon]|nr:DUF5320 domain-containing protein [Candidatus Heimdallarchaeota archaeon]
MPFGDKTGPERKGPKSGRVLGICTGNETGGYVNDENRLRKRLGNRSCHRNRHRNIGRVGNTRRIEASMRNYGRNRRRRNSSNQGMGAQQRDGWLQRDFDGITEVETKEV